MLYLLMALLQAAPQPATPPPSGLILGRVVDATSGRPVPGAIVTLTGGGLVPLAGGFVAGPTASGQPRAMTNANGQFVFRRLSKGTFSLTATRLGYVDGAYGRRRPGGTMSSIPLDDGQRVGDVVIRMWRQASIAGTVTDEAGEPLISVTVRLFERRMMAGKRRFLPGRTGFTDDRGVYKFGGLTPGDYVVGFIAREVTVPLAVAEASRTPAAPNDKAAQQLQRDRAQMGGFAPPPGSSGSIQMGDSVRQLNPQQPIPPIGSGAGAAVYVYPTTYFPNAPSAARATVLTVESGQQRDGVDFSLHPIKSLRVSGMVIGPDGPAANMPLRLVPTGDDGSASPIADTSATMADGSGNFTFIGVTPGQYSIRGSRVPATSAQDTFVVTQIQMGGSFVVGSSSSNPSAAPPPIPDDPALYVNVDVAVGESDTKDLVVPLQRGPRVTGRVEFEGAGMHPDPSALPRIQILLIPADGGSPLGSGAPLGHADETGAFKTYGQPPGKYSINVLGVPNGWTLKSVTSEGRDVSEALLELSTADANNVVITFTDRPTKLTGVARTKDGNVDPDALIVVFPADPSAWSNANSRRMRSARAQSNGTYSINGLPAGDYYAAAVSDESSQWQDPQVLAELARTATQVRLGDGDTRTQDLVRSGS